jgi:hypothetical protein
VLGQHTLSIDAAKPIIVRMGIASAPYPASFFGMPCGAPKRTREDVSYQPLQPIYDTSTHRPFDSRANSFR